MTELVKPTQPPIDKANIKGRLVSNRFQPLNTIVELGFNQDIVPKIIGMFDINPDTIKAARNVNLTLSRTIDNYALNNGNGERERKDMSWRMVEQALYDAATITHFWSSPKDMAELLPDNVTDEERSSIIGSATINEAAIKLVALYAKPLIIEAKTTPVGEQLKTLENQFLQPLEDKLAGKISGYKLWNDSDNPTDQAPPEPIIEGLGRFAGEINLKLDQPAEPMFSMFSGNVINSLFDKIVVVEDLKTGEIGNVTQNELDEHPEKYKLIAGGK